MERINNITLLDIAGIVLVIIDIIGICYIIYDIYKNVR